MKTLYFDGVCNLCNRFVDFLIRRDRKHVLSFAPIQGKTAGQRLPKAAIQNLNTLIFETEGQHYFESTGAIRAIASTGFLFKPALILLLVPVGWRDHLYRAVAKNRYSWFGKRDSCRLPTPEEKAQFLD